MNLKHRTVYLAVVAALAGSGAQIVLAQDGVQTIEEMIVTGVRMDSPLNITTDPKTPRQPLPAHDGADYLKTIPGFSVIRKGGADGDPVLRGMAGSRLSMMLDGEMILGGCNNRMDPPTAYIFPETFDSIKVIKGPQSVQHGPGNSAGVVLFERDDARPTESGWKVYSSATAASFGRHDEVIDASYASPQFTLRGAATSAQADNYEDGDGTEIHSQYRRWNTQLSAAWTPSDATRMELGLARSDGEAAYADRGVDGSKFARENYSFKVIQKDLAPWIKQVEANAYYNYVDHVMDNFTLRSPSGMMPMPSAMNPDRQTTGARVALTLQSSPTVDWVVGLDTQNNEHTNRMSMNNNATPYESLPRLADAEFRQIGVFAELGWNIGAASRLVTGLRADDWRAWDLRAQISPTMMLTLPNPTRGQERSEVLHSGFVRFETDLGRSGATLFAGLGHNERFPDYWEMIAKETATSTSAFNVESEKLTQLDFGMMYRNGRIDGSVSAFVSEIDDFLMIQSGVMKPMMAMGGMGNMGGMTLRPATIVRNIDARTWGMEVDGRYQISDAWRAELTLASVRGANDTDGRTLPQLSPLEGRVGLYYDNSVWSTGVLWRSIGDQNRFDLGRGNIAGQDLGATAGADVVSVNAGWRYSDALSFTAGVDNLTDVTYAEHISRAGASIPGFDQTTRVNEPGRTLWVRAQYTF